MQQDNAYINYFNCNVFAMSIRKNKTTLTFDRTHWEPYVYTFDPTKETINTLLQRI